MIFGDPDPEPDPDPDQIWKLTANYLVLFVDRFKHNAFFGLEYYFLAHDKVSVNSQISGPLHHFLLII